MNETQVARAVGASAILFGAFATATPGLVGKAFGLSNVDHEVRYLIRFAGTANAALGVNLATASDADTRRRLLLLAAVVDGTNGLLALRAGLSTRTTLIAAASSGAVAAAASIALLRTPSHTP